MKKNKKLIIDHWSIDHWSEKIKVKKLQSQKILRLKHQKSENLKMFENFSKFPISYTFPTFPRKSLLQKNIFLSVTEWPQNTEWPQTTLFRRGSSPQKYPGPKWVHLGMPGPARHFFFKIFFLRRGAPLRTRVVCLYSVCILSAFCHTQKIFFVAGFS